MEPTPAMRIRKLHVESFGCVKDATVELEPLTVLVGPNDSGKSTLLRALSTLGEASRLPDGWRGVFPSAQSLVAQTFNGRGDSVRLELAGEVGLQGFDYGVEVTGAPGYSAIESEHVYGFGVRIDRANGNLTFQSPGNPSSVGKENDGVRPLLHNDTLMSGITSVSPGTPIVETTGFKAFRPLFRGVQAMSSYSLRPERLRLPSSPGTRLCSDGGGLSSAIANLLLNDRDVVERIEATIVAAMPHVKRLGISQQSGSKGQQEYDIQIVTRSGARIPSPMISDGVLLYIGYLYLVLGPNPASVLLVEEPETGIHFGLLKSVMKLFRDLTTGAHGGPPTQVILTTHSPMLLNLVEPEEIRIVERGDDGATQVSRFSDAPGLAKLLDYQGPGEIWVNQGEEFLTKRGAPRS